jgi:GDSL-like Lipase/Acylhydrolase family
MHMPSLLRPKVLFLRFEPALIAGAILVAGVNPGSAHARPRSGPAVVVSMGDSMISGVAGRWKGNSLTDTGSKDGTDRACVPGPTSGSCSSYDLNSIYVDGTAADDCERSDVAEVLSARIPGIHGVNIACGGAPINSLLTTAQGGKRFHGEPPQGDSLATVARQDNVRMIVIVMGANNTDLGSVVTDCAASYAGLGPAKACTAAKAAFPKEIPIATQKLEHAVAEVRQTMSAQGYHAGDYRLVLQDYAVGLARSSQVRYPQSDESARFTDGCPFSNADLNWINDVNVRYRSMVETAARHSGTEFMDISNVLNGHQVCSIDDSLVTSEHPPSAKTSEWSRFFAYEHLLAQAPPESTDDALGEILHPNYFGQRAFGACLTQTAASPAGQHTCTTIKGSTHTEVATTTSATDACPSTTHPTYHLVQPRSGRITTERVYHNGKLWRTFHGHKITQILLPPITSATFTLKLVETTTSHLQITTTLRYHGCHT